jgi:hypothetical protein
MGDLLYSEHPVLEERVKKINLTITFFHKTYMSGAQNIQRSHTDTDAV